MTEAKFGNFTITTDYAYGEFKDIKSHIDYLDHLRYDLQGGNFDKNVRQALAKRMVFYAKKFLEDSGHVKTGKLLRSIKEDSTQGRSIMVEATAPYSGHIEYGFRRGGKVVGPFPYLRPALQTVAAESRGELELYLKARCLSQSPNYYFKSKGLDLLSMSVSPNSSSFRNLGNILLGNYQGSKAASNAKYIKNGNLGGTKSIISNISSSTNFKTYNSNNQSSWKKQS